MVAKLVAEAAIDPLTATGCNRRTRDSGSDRVGARPAGTKLPSRFRGGSLRPSPAPA